MLIKIKLRKKIEADEKIDSMMDLSKYLKPWPTKPRNKRQPISPLPTPPPVLDSRGVSSSSEASVEPDSGNLKRKLEETDQNGPGKCDYKIQKIDSGMGFQRSSDTEGHVYAVETRETEMNQVRENDYPATLKTPKRYACNVCNKTFSNHSALGGHKSSHSKFSIVISDAIDDRRKNQSLRNTCEQPQTGKTEEIQASPRSVLGNEHKCKICSKIFSSGQALGGHQRRHWTGNLPVKKTQSSVPKILAFDLNELPKEEDEDLSLTL